MVICMTNGGMYSDVRVIEGYAVSEIDVENIIKRLGESRFIGIINGTEACVLRTSCISSINFK